MVICNQHILCEKEKSIFSKKKKLLDQSLPKEIKKEEKNRLLNEY